MPAALQARNGSSPATAPPWPWLTRSADRQEARRSHRDVSPRARTARGLGSSPCVLLTAAEAVMHGHGFSNAADSVTKLDGLWIARGHPLRFKTMLLLTGRGRARAVSVFRGVSATQGGEDDQDQEAISH